MTFFDQDCGIEVAHRHTGELSGGMYLQYWCPRFTAWVSWPACPPEESCLHMKARTQTTMTEIIEILPEQTAEDWIREQLQERMDYLFFEGEDAYRLKYGY